METSRESNKNYKISSQRCSRNKINERIKDPKLKKIWLHFKTFSLWKIRQQIREWEVLIKYSHNPQLHITNIQDQLVVSSWENVTLKFEQFSIKNKCLTDWNQLQKYLKTNFKDIKRSEFKNIVTNHLLKQYTR